MYVLLIVLLLIPALLKRMVISYTDTTKVTVKWHSRTGERTQKPYMGTVGKCPAGQLGCNHPLIDPDRPHFILVGKYLFDIYFKVPGDPERKIERRDILPFFYCKDRLSGYTNCPGKILLREIVHSPVYLDLILHRSPIPRISLRNRT